MEEGSEHAAGRGPAGRSRQLAHDQAELLAGMVEVSHAVAVDDLPADLPGGRGGAVARVEKQFEWPSHEIAAGLTLTPIAADRELGFAAAVCERLPLVFAALQRGDIDRGKARVFVEYLDPANGEVSQCGRTAPPGRPTGTSMRRCRYSAVLRRPPLGDVLATAHDVGWEYRVLATLADTAVPVPRPVILWEDSAATGAPFYVMEFVGGDMLRTGLVRGVRVVQVPVILEGSTTAMSPV